MFFYEKVVNQRTYHRVTKYSLTGSDKFMFIRDALRDLVSHVQVKIVKNTHRGVLLLAKLQASAMKLKVTFSWYQIAQSVSCKTSSKIITMKVITNLDRYIGNRDSFCQYKLVQQLLQIGPVITNWSTTNLSISRLLLTNASKRKIQFAFFAFDSYHVHFLLNKNFEGLHNIFETRQRGHSFSSYAKFSEKLTFLTSLIRTRTSRIKR